jgi:hypothetical protein
VLTSFPPPKVDPKSRAVELVAQALCDGDAADHGTYDWSVAGKRLRDDYRRAARHALDAMDATADALAAGREEVFEPIRELAHQFASVASEHRGYPLDSHQTGVRDAYTDVAIRLRRFLEAT